MKLHQVWEVGGCVRDLLLNEIHGTSFKIKDIDFAVEAPYGEMLVWMKQEGFKVHVETPQYLTIRAGIPEGHPLRARATDADFAVCRTEGSYSDGRRPDEVKPGTIQEDLSRRDFTANAIAVNAESGEVLDPHNGRSSVEERRLVCVGKAEDRFTEDALRALRAMRFAITKEFTLGWAIRNALRADWLPPLLAKISNERKVDELTKCFRFDTIETMHLLTHFDHANEAGLLESIFDGTLWLTPSLAKH